MRRLLIVEDDPDHAESLADLLAVHDHVVETVSSGEAAIARFAEAEFDAVLIDIRLPRRNGIDTLLALRRSRPDLPAILMTGYSVPALLSQAGTVGALGVLHKPIDADRLLGMLRASGPSTAATVPPC